MREVSQHPLFASYRKQAQACLDEGGVGDIEFSGGTYQVQVQLPGEEEGYWAFFQLDDQGQPKDYFCSCTRYDDSASCVHLAAAYLAIFRENEHALHIRYQCSFWNVLFRAFAENQLEQAPERRGTWTYVLGSFRAVAKDEQSREQLKQLFEQRPEQTEETSLKFSNLEESELDLWHRGHPSPELRYELSVWSDLAKLLMLKQDQGQSYRLEFSCPEGALPDAVSVFFPGLDIHCGIEGDKWPSLVRGLQTVESPLAVHLSEEEGIESITYDALQSEFHIQAKSLKEGHEKGRGIEVGDWSYHPGDGFYAQEVHHLLAEPLVRKKDVPKVLDEHGELLASYLQGTCLHREPVDLKLSVHFDENWDLHLSTYLWEEGDLSDPSSQHFGRWIYKEGEGFYPLKKGEVGFLNSVLSGGEIAEFISRRRSSLNRIPGFKVHVVSIDTYLDYRMTEDGYLFLESRLDLAEEEMTADFGPWLYVKGQGFFSKSSSHPRALLAAGQGIPPVEIPRFIRRAREDLKHVRGFFSEHCPITACFLNVEVEEGARLVFSPHYSHDHRFDLETLHFYEEFVYIEGEGFHVIPNHLRLPDGYWQPRVIRSAALAPFLEEELPKLRPFIREEGPLLDIPERLEAEVLKAEPVEQEGQVIIALELVYLSEFGSVTASELWSAIDKGQHYYFSSAGLVDLQQARFDYLREIGEERVDVDHNQLFVSTLELIRLDAFEELPALEKEATQDIWHPLLGSIFSVDPDEKPPLRGLKSQLRAYQEVGVRWLWQLYRCQLSGMLCDDMGLGKTHQAMALLTAVRNHRKGHKPLFLIVCPTSVIYHWQDKLTEFLPSARVHTYYGVKRSLNNGRKRYDVLLTSYGVLRRDRERLKNLSFDLAIFDEVQIAKNHLSGIHAALLELKVQMRLGLTGTPIENRIRELKSLFDIVLPGYMPTESHYRDLFITPIEKYFDEVRQQLLSRMIKPFVLRRKKEDVLSDLPEKTEETAHCELLSDQRELYSAAIESARTGVLSTLADESQIISYTHVFALLTSLKQICDHPAVYLKDVQGYKNYQSGKWNLFIELLKEARASRQKVVVFSQYLGMMDIIEHYLHEKGIGYAGIRGATRDRAEQMRRFEEDPQCEVFVASLQAAGLGIDLTSASVVILYDRWWNAAREKQAIDRVHRIGQTRGVQVFKMVCKDSFEERIDEMIRLKGQLMEDVVGVDGENFLKLLSRDELLLLLRDVHGQ